MFRSPRGTLFLPLLCLAAWMLSACGTVSPVMRTWEDAERTEEECEDPSADACRVFACEGSLGACGVFSCEGVDPEALASAHLTHGVQWVRSGAYRPVRPPRPPSRGPSRDYRRSGIRPGMPFHFRYRYGYLPAFPDMGGSRLVKHHLFSQEETLARWFVRHGINIHEFTMVVPEHLHLRLHNPGGRGGPWNAAWREYMNANLHRRHIPKEELLRKALELAFRFDFTGPIVPYYGHPIPPPGPWIFADP